MNERNMLLKDQEYWESRISHFPAYPKIPTKKMPQEITKQVFKRYTKEMTKHKWELLKKIGEKAKHYSLKYTSHSICTYVMGREWE